MLLDDLDTFWDDRPWRHNGAPARVGRVPESSPRFLEGLLMAHERKRALPVLGSCNGSRLTSAEGDSRGGACFGCYAPVGIDEGGSSWS